MSAVYISGIISAASDNVTSVSFFPDISQFKNHNSEDLKYMEEKKVWDWTNQREEKWVITFWTK